MSHLPPSTPSPRPPGEPRPGAHRADGPRTRSHRADDPRLGGALMVLFWCACGITAIPLAAAFAFVANLGVAGTQAALVDGFTGPGLSAQLLRLGLIPQAMLFVWGLAMVVLTIAKSRHALTIVPWLLILWVAVSAYCQFAIREALSPGGTDVMDFAALMPGLLIQGAAAAALFGYFSEGSRPRAFYRR